MLGQLPGKFVWFELVSSDVTAAKTFYGELFGWSVVPLPIGSATYQAIYAGDTMIGGYTSLREDDQPSRWTSYVSVEDVDAAAEAAASSGGEVIELPASLPGAGRRAGITDPLGAELYLVRKAAPDPVDRDTAPHGHWLWSELHTPDPMRALTFYEKVVGFTHRPFDRGTGGHYHVLSRGGVGRAGVTDHLPPGSPAHWLPYVSVDDPGAVVSRAKRLGAAVTVGPMDIPRVGRFAVIADPTGATLAVMTPLPVEKPGSTPPGQRC